MSTTFPKRLTPVGHSSIATPGAVLGKLRQRHTLPLYVLSLSMLQLTGDHILQTTLTRLKQFSDVQHDLWWMTGAGHTVNLDVRLAAKEVQLLWCNTWVGIHWKYVEIKSELWWYRLATPRLDRRSLFRLCCLTTIFISLSMTCLLYTSPSPRD